jgi:hypothetical protein
LDNNQPTVNSDAVAHCLLNSRQAAAASISRYFEAVLIEALKSTLSIEHNTGPYNLLQIESAYATLPPTGKENAYADGHCQGTVLIQSIK